MMTIEIVVLTLTFAFGLGAGYVGTTALLTFLGTMYKRWSFSRNAGSRRLSKQDLVNDASTELEARLGALSRTKFGQRSATSRNVPGGASNISARRKEFLDKINK